MHNRADQLGKSILREALSRASTAETEVEVLAATQRIDVYSIPDPTREAERAQMGLLGELSAEPSLFEPFRNTPTLRLYPSGTSKLASQVNACHHFGAPRPTLRECPSSAALA